MLQNIYLLLRALLTVASLSVIVVGDDDDVIIINDDGDCDVTAGTFGTSFEWIGDCRFDDDNVLSMLLENWRKKATARELNFFREINILPLHHYLPNYAKFAEDGVKPFQVDFHFLFSKDFESFLRMTSE